MKKRFVVVSFFVAGVAVGAACTDNGSRASGVTTGPDGGIDGGGMPEPVEPGDDAGDPSDASDAGPSTCALTRAYETACGRDLTCGDAHFDDWCATNDQANDSLAFRRGEAMCLVAPSNCDPDVRKNCDYESYATATPTTAQTQLVAAYCATCAPGDAACAMRAVTYDVDAGPNGVTDIFIAAWELSDALTDAIRASCTGPALDVGADCAKAFSDCAGGVYVDHLPDCPP